MAGKKTGVARFAFRGLFRALFYAGGLVLASPGEAMPGNSPEPESPKFTGTAIPQAPEQSEAWTAPANTLPADAVGAITTLFSQGLADPRGCEYREVSLVVGSCWGGYGTLKTHGWVLPTKDAQQFAVGWDGLVNPCVSVGASADLAADVRAMLAKDEAQIGEARTGFANSEKERQLQAKQTGQTYTHVDWPLRWNNNAVPEDRGLSVDDLLPIKAALVLRAGRGELASKMWAEWFGVKLSSPSKDLYWPLADAWAWSLFDRAVCAHMRGDDHLALASEDLLLTIAPQIEKETAARTLERPQFGTSDGAGQKPYLGFLDQLADLRADDQRRMEEAPVTPVLQMTNPPQGHDRVVGLIRDLEFVSARQWGQPGGVSLGGDPVVAALIQCGDDAVEPLLDCLENDNRFTRSVHFGRDFFQSRTVIGVPEAAYVALAGILQSDFFSVGSTGDSLTAHGQKGRHEVAQAIRAYWQKNKGLKLEERWYETLKDDHASSNQWLEAADNITQDTDVQIERSSMFGGWTTMPSRKPGQIAPMRGETLRAKTGPSVSDLLVSRMQGLSAPMNQLPDTNMDSRVQLALALAKWDGKAHMVDLAALTEDMKKALLLPNADGMRLPQSLLRIYHAREKVGDPQVLADYAAWLPTVTREEVQFGGDSPLDLMWQHPNDPAMQNAARQLFTSPNSPWVPLYKAPGQPGPYFTSPLVGLKEFRVELLRGLADTSPVGTLLVASDGRANPNVPGSGGTEDDIWKHDPLAPRVGGIVTFRVCDLYAHELACLDAAPRCQLYWPLPKRDAAVQACIAFLKKYGDLYQYREGQRVDPTDFLHQARIQFPRLDEPATPADVEQNRAIFALSGERRVWRMPEFPMNAKWIALKDVMREQQYAGPNGSGVNLICENDGKVLQAEEVLVDGKWQRWFGFAGSNRLAKVPASEIEFPDPEWATLAHGFQCRVLGPTQSGEDGTGPARKLTGGQPLMMKVKLRNSSGLDQAIPRGVMGPATHPVLVLPDGIEVKLGYSPRADGDLWSIPDSDWQPVPYSRKFGVDPDQTEGPTLAPTQEQDILALDLRDFFDVSRPGIYRIEILFGKPLSGNSAPVTFVIPGK